MDEVLKVVLEMAGVQRADLFRVEKGPRANPARRVAFIAMSEHSQATHREIGKKLETLSANMR